MVYKNKHNKRNGQRMVLTFAPCPSTPSNLQKFRKLTFIFAVSCVLCTFAHYQWAHTRGPRLIRKENQSD
jgi:hypothetical protein